MKNNISMQSASMGAAETLGTVDGILTAADTKLFQDDIARIFYSYMSKGIDQGYRQLALANPSRYGHMYDWNMLGVSGGKLWRHHLTGSPTARRATYSFSPSKVPVPATTPENTGIDPSDFPELRNNGRYMFPNKAMVFESGMTTKIAPRNAKALFVPLKHKSASGWKNVKFRGTLNERDEERGFIWVRTPVEQEHKSTMGAFTAYYLNFYSSNADRIFAERVEPRIDKSIRKVYNYRMPNLGGSNTVSRTAIARTAKFSVGAAANASKIADAQLRKEMRAAVREATMDMEYEDYE